MKNANNNNTVMKLENVVACKYKKAVIKGDNQS